MKAAAGHVVFITNQLKTLFYIALAVKLRADGFTVSWIATSKRWSREVRAGGAADADILDIWKLGPIWRAGRVPTAAQRQLLARVEAAGRHTIRNLILMDRELRSQSPRVALAYVANIAEAVSGFLDGRGADVLVGECTWCVETLSGQTAMLHGVRYCVPDTLRLPSSRMYFLSDQTPDPFLIWRQPDLADRHLAAETVKSQNSGLAKPYYMNNIPSPFVWKDHWTREIKEALSTGDGNMFDISVPPLWKRAGRRLRFAWYSFLARWFIRFEPGPSDPTMPYVFITLHYQPEASVDNLGAPFANQYETIAALARIVPLGTEILVKEHRAAIGCRSPGYYARLKQLPGVRLIAASANTPVLMRGARLVASPSGTASLEAAVMGVPSVCFGKIPFGDALLQQRFDPYGTSPAEMAALLDAAAREQACGALAQKAFDHLAIAIANSVEARVGDPVGNPEVLAPENLAAISGGLAQACALVRGTR